MLTATGMNLENVEALRDVEITRETRSYDSLKFDDNLHSIPILSLNYLTDFTPQSSGSNIIEFATLDDNSDEIPMPDFTTIGYVRLHISKVSNLEPPTVDF